MVVDWVWREFDGVNGGYAVGGRGCEGERLSWKHGSDLGASGEAAEIERGEQERAMWNRRRSLELNESE